MINLDVFLTLFMISMTSCPFEISRIYFQDMRITRTRYVWFTYNGLKNIGYMCVFSASRAKCWYHIQLALYLKCTRQCLSRMQKSHVRLGCYANVRGAICDHPRVVSWRLILNSQLWFGQLDPGIVWCSNRWATECVWVLRMQRVRISV